MSQDLGKLISIHGTSPAYLQRAAIVSILSFVFFIAMLLAFYLRQQILYFILSSAFLVVYLFTMIGWLMQKRNTVKIYNNGMRYRKFAARWDEIESINETGSGVTIIKVGGDDISLGPAVHDLSEIVRLARSKARL